MPENKLCRCLASVLIALLPACGTMFDPFADPPGKGSTAMRLMATAEPVIAAIERFHMANGKYPDSLINLVPEFIGQVPQMMSDGGMAPKSLSYLRQEGSYQLSFTYSGPGMNRCQYEPETKWICSGWY